jgi:acyl carrier protein
MTPQELKALIVRTLASVAPEADLASLDPAEDLRDALDLDSMDILRFATALHEQLGVDIPEADYTKIVRLNDCVSYLAKRLGP